MNTEPDLFSWQEAPSERSVSVVAFPLARCVGKVRVVAKVIMRCKTEKTRQAAFDRAAMSITRKLRAAGISEAEVTEQISRFAESVNAELSRGTRRQA